MAETKPSSEAKETKPPVIETTFQIDPAAKARSERRYEPPACMGRVVYFAFATEKGPVERPARVVAVSDVGEDKVNLNVDLDGPGDRDLLEFHERSFAHVSHSCVWRKDVPKNENPDVPAAGTWRYPPRVG